MFILQNIEVDGLKFSPGGMETFLIAVPGTISSVTEETLLATLFLAKEKGVTGLEIRLRTNSLWV